MRTFIGFLQFGHGGAWSCRCDLVIMDVRSFSGALFLFLHPALFCRALDRPAFFGALRCAVLLAGLRRSPPPRSASTLRRNASRDRVAARDPVRPNHTPISAKQ